MDSFSAVTLWLIEVLLVTTASAMDCIIGQEPDPGSHHELRWVIPVEEPCLCTLVHVGGRMNHAPHRPFKVSYYDRFLHSDDPLEIRAFLNCSAEEDRPVTASNEGGISSVAVCTDGQALGLEDGRIPDSRITASSDWKGMTPNRGRLNYASSPAAWSSDNSQSGDPWIQVEFPAGVHVTAVVTQGRADKQHWVSQYQVKSSDQGVSWLLVGEFSGNSDSSSPVTNLFNSAVYTTFIRILPTSCKGHCSMRFELLGCD